MKLFRTPYFFRWIFHRRVWGFSFSDRVYLTFDDGPTERLTPWILEELDRHGVKATFFCVGQNAKDAPKLMDDIRSAGHVVGNHTMRHEKGTSTSKDDYMASVKEAEPYTSSVLFRPPYGRIPMTFTRELRSKYKMVMWTWLSYDFDKSVPVDLILKKAERIKGGDILVVHDNIKTEDRLKELLPELIRIVQNKGLEFEVIS